MTKPAWTELEEYIYCGKHKLRYMVHLNDCPICVGEQMVVKPVVITTADLKEDEEVELLYCPECNNYLEGGDGEMKNCHCGWEQPKSNNDGGDEDVED